ncbi:hypothetical protein ACHWQZ_G015032 [Mnemiopsis leidyi]
MRVEVVVSRLCLILIFTVGNYVRSEGTLYIELLRYQNDTCGGFVQDSGICDYSVSLSIQTAVYRGCTLQPDITLQQHDGFDNTGILHFTYRLECDPNFIGIGCQDCKDGMFGMKCEVRCEENANFSCNPETGDKICRDNHYGDKCDKFCEDTESYTCTERGNKFCIYPAIGEECHKETTCPENKFGSKCDVTCSPLPGHFLCSENGTRVCDGNFAGPDCTSCTEHHYGAHCNLTCVPNLPRYTCSSEGEHVCRQGWTGAQCTQCADTWFGERCDIHCEMSSRYNCTDQGQKVCLGNWNPATNCSSCIRHYYGPNCQVYCKKEFGLWKCNKTTGEKICLQLTNRAGENCTECKQDYYLDGETSTCRYCKETERYWCGQAGQKRCKHSWYGEECSTQCHETSRNTCHPKHGSLICKSHYSGKNCQACIDQYFGETCDVYCPDTKRNDCDPETGEMVCKKDYFGSYCQTFCNTSSNFYSCDSSGVKTCKGKRNITTDCEKCIKDWYGPKCDTYCNPVNPRTQCAQNGSLICVKGWAGEQCSECAPNWYGSTCEGNGWSLYDESGTCRKTCDMFCQDMTNYKCNKDGVLEMTPEFAELWYNDHYELKVTGIITGLMVVYLVSALFLYKICFVWYPSKNTP